RGPWSAAVAAVERRSASPPRCGARDRVDDELGVVADPADQRRAARVLQVHAEEVQPGRIADAAPMAGRAALVEDWNLDPRVVGPEARRPHDRLHVEGSPVGESDGPAACRDGARQELDAVAARELPQAGADQQVSALRPAAPTVERRLDEADALAPPVQALAEDPPGQARKAPAAREVDAM